MGSGGIEKKEKNPVVNDNRQKQKNYYEQEKATTIEAFGHLALFVFSHILCLYLWWSATFNNGCVGNPFPIQREVYDALRPNKISIVMYGTIIIGQLLLSAIMPGINIKGFKIPQENNRQLNYLCNGLSSWYLCIVLAVFVHMTGYFDLKILYYNSGAMLSTAIIFSDVIAVIMYVECLRTKRCSVDSVKQFAHDFVMGGYLNPRIGHVDLKMWAEIRVSWLLLFALDVSGALCLHEKLGYVPYRMLVILLIHGLYTNACMKGEESIPFTWDIFQEKWGWMLIYWNLAGVAFAYTFNGRFITEQMSSGELDDINLVQFTFLAVCVIAAYWVFDEANAQKNRFRAIMTGVHVERPWALPQLPNATLTNPKFIKTKTGSKLLIDGWWKYVRKPHYTADMCLALLLCLPCGLPGTHFLPYFFACFFLPMLIHRGIRDNERCAKKYGKDWDEYISLVPYTLVPGIY